MASQNKKNKARNSYIHNGGEKLSNWRCKGIMYFTKAQRNKDKKSVDSEISDANDVGD